MGTPTEDTTTAPGAAPGALRLVEEFANTLDVENGTDELATADQAGAWLAAYPGLRAADLPPPRITPTELAQLRAFRAALREILRANHDGSPADAAYEALNGMADAVPLRVHLHAGQDARLEAPPAPIPFAVGRLLAAIYDGIAGGTWKRLKVCPADTCQWVFYDRSRNRSGTWCSMKVCGNRAKVRRYQQKLRGNGAGDA